MRSKDYNMGSQWPEVVQCPVCTEKIYVSDLSIFATLSFRHGAYCVKNTQCTTTKGQIALHLEIPSVYTSDEIRKERIAIETTLR